MTLSGAAKCGALGAACQTVLKFGYEKLLYQILCFMAGGSVRRPALNFWYINTARGFRPASL